MRSSLKQIDDQRPFFTGVFSRYGTKSSFRGMPKITVLLLNIKDQTGKPVADHLWLNRTKGFQAVEPFGPEDTLEFRARVKKYTKGYRGYREDVAVEKPLRSDYKLSHPTAFRVVQRGPGGGIVPLPVGAR